MSDFIAGWLTPTSLFLLLNVVIGTIFLLSRLSPPKTPSHHGGGYYSYSSPPPLQRASSLLDRVKSINFSTFKFDDGHHNLQQHVDSDSEPHPLGRAPSILERVKSINLNLYKYPPQNPDPVYVEQPLSRPPSLLERVKSIDFTSFYRSDSGKVYPETSHLPTDEEPSKDIDTSNTPAHAGQLVKRSKSEHNNVKQRKVAEKMKKSASENSRGKAEEEEEVERRRPATTRIEKDISLGDGEDQGVDAKADDFISKFKQQLKLQRLDSLMRYRDMLRSKPSK